MNKWIKNIIDDLNYTPYCRGEDDARAGRAARNPYRKFSTSWESYNYGYSQAVISKDLLNDFEERNKRK